MTKRLRRAGPPLLGLALAAFVLLGLADGSTGVAWPSMRGAFSRNLSDLGVLLAAGSVGYLAASTAYGWLHARLGTGTALFGGGCLMAGALGAYALAGSFVVVLVAALTFGLGAGLIDSGVNAHAALGFDVRSINLLHAAYGIGATAGPIVITASLTFGTMWRGGYALLAIAQATVVAVLWRARHRWVSNPHQEEIDVAPPRRKMVVLLLGLFLLYTGAEVAAGQWAFSLLSEGRGIPEVTAGVWVAAYWGGLTLGRFVFGVTGDRIPPSRLISGSIAVATAGLAVLWWDPAGLGPIGLPIAGMGFAAVFPTMVSLTPVRIGRDRSTGMVGYQLAAANIGAATVPLVLGLIAEQYGILSLGPALVTVTIILGALHLITDRVA